MVVLGIAGAGVVMTANTFYFLTFGAFVPAVSSTDYVMEILYLTGHKLSATTTVRENHTLYLACS